MSQLDNTTPHLSNVYDAQVRDTIPYYETFHLEAIKLVNARPAPPRRWLDTGCGTGTLVERAAPLFPETVFFLADPAAGMLEEAQRKLAPLPPERMLFLAPTATQAIPREFFGGIDVVTAIQSHHYLSRDDRGTATRVCYDLLTPGGIYITFENIRPFTAEGIRIGKENWRQFQLSRGKALPAVDSHLQRFDAEYFPITVDEHLALLRASGFQVVELLWYACMQAGFYAIK